jgi:hypothetical protein
MSVAAIVVAGLALLGGSAHRAATATSSRAPQLQPGPSTSIDPLAEGSKVALGLNTDGPPAAAIESFSRLAGARPRIFMWYQTWDGPFDASEIHTVESLGAIPMITWDPQFGATGIPLSEIAAGRYDHYIKSAADAAAAWKHTVYIRFGHEMNLAGAPFGPGHDGNTPAAFVAAWRHVVGIFQRRGATKVEWVWSPNIYCDGHCPFTAFYPGDAWVDWVALDGYNYGPVDGDPWMTFDQIFGPSYAVLTRMTAKPVMIGETASTELGGSKAQWISGMGRVLVSDFPRVRGLIWFQRIKETDWRINSSPESLAAFRALARSPLFEPLDA